MKYRIKQINRQVDSIIDLPTGSIIMESHHYWADKFCTEKRIVITYLEPMVE